MRHEKIIKRPDGSRVKIEVTIYLPSETETPNVKYIAFMSTCEANKDKFINNMAIQEVNYPFYSQYITNEEIQEAKRELWEKLKPVNK